MQYRFIASPLVKYFTAMNSVRGEFFSCEAVSNIYSCQWLEQNRGARGYSKRISIPQTDLAIYSL